MKTSYSDAAAQADDWYDSKVTPDHDMILKEMGYPTRHQYTTSVSKSTYNCPPLQLADDTIHTPHTVHKFVMLYICMNYM